MNAQTIVQTTNGIALWTASLGRELREPGRGGGAGARCGSFSSARADLGARAAA